MLPIDKSPAAKVARYIYFPDSADFTPAGDLTIELFGVKFPTLAAAVLINHYNAYSPLSNQRSWLLQYAGAQLQFACSADGSGLTFIGYAWTPTLNQPYDLAVDRSGGTVRIYVDGTRVTSGVKNGSLFNSSDGLVIGAGRHGDGFANPFGGSALAVRLTNGVARYATDGSYLVPSLPLPTA